VFIDPASNVKHVAPMRAPLISETLMWHDIPSAERVLLRITKLLMPNNRVESESRTQRGEIFVV
jgi:hypothetical protein